MSFNIYHEIYFRYISWFTTCQNGDQSLVISLCSEFTYLEVCDVAMVSGCHTAFSLAQSLGFFWCSLPHLSYSPHILRFRVQGYAEALTVSLTLSLTTLYYQQILFWWRTLGWWLTPVWSSYWTSDVFSSIMMVPGASAWVPFVIGNQNLNENSIVSFPTFRCGVSYREGQGQSTKEDKSLQVLDFFPNLLPFPE